MNQRKKKQTEKETTLRHSAHTHSQRDAYKKTQKNAKCFKKKKRNIHFYFRILFYFAFDEDINLLALTDLDLYVCAFH